MGNITERRIAPDTRVTMRHLEAILPLGLNDARQMGSFSLRTRHFR